MMDWRRTPGHPAARVWATWVPYCLVAFALSHLAYYLLGVRFDASSLGWFWQYLDPELLRGRLLESLFYLHSQPPLFNLFLGIVLKLAPGREALAFQIVYVACGLVLYLALFRLLGRLGISRPIAFGASTLFMISPSFVLYENWLFYTFPLTVLMTLSVLFLHAMLNRRSAWFAAGFVLALFSLVAIRGLFHLVYYIVIVSALAWAMPGGRRVLLIAAVLPFLFLLLIYGKNLILFGKFTSGTWIGMNAWTVTARNLPLSERERLVSEGKLSELSLIDRFAELERYPAPYLQVAGYEQIPAVRQVRKSTGYPNYNHLAYIAISDVYLRDAWYVLKHYPSTAVIGSLRSWYAYFRSSSDYVFLVENRKKLAAINDLYDLLFYGKLPVDLARFRDSLPIYTSEPGRYLYVFLLFGLPLLVFGGLRCALRSDPTAVAPDRRERIVLLYICFNIVYVAFVGNMLESGENNRFRFMTDPLYLVLFGFLAQRWLATGGVKVRKRVCRRWIGQT